MLYIGCDTFSNHPIFTKHPNNYKSKSTLVNYAQHLNCVQLDYPFYYVPTQHAIWNWIKQVPTNFKFILKANRRMTKQDYGQNTTPQQWQNTIMAYNQNIQPMLKSHQLLTVLLQFPRYFYNTEANVQYILKIRKLMPEIPLSVEFRHPSWYQSREQETKLADIFAKHRITITIADEPNNNYDGVPFMPILTTKNLVFIRLHGENYSGWHNRFNNPNWRNTRTLYKYSLQELQTLSNVVTNLGKVVNNVCVIFNNNSARNAAPNAMQFKNLQKLNYPNQKGKYHMQVKVVKGDITKSKCDAIVNPTDHHCSGGGTLDKLIHNKAGRKNMREACNKIGVVNTGQAKTTLGFKLPAKYVIQTVGPKWHGGRYGEASLLASCYKNCIKEAVKHGCKSIAFPSISTGAFHYPLGQATQVVANVFKSIVLAKPLNIKLVCYDKKTFHAYKKALK